MPELAECEITRRKLLARVKGKVFAGFWTDWPRGLKLAEPGFIGRDITGRKILNVRRQGKVIFIDLSGRPEKKLAFHQRMSGRLECFDAFKNLRANRHAHFVFRFVDGSRLLFVDPRKFGVVWYGEPKDFVKDRYLRTLGEDLTETSFGRFFDRIKERKQAIKAVLLRQDVVSGIGNIIADESLWEGGIHPAKRASLLCREEARKLFRFLRNTVYEILKAGGTSMRDWGHPDGQRGSYQDRYKVYGRAGQKCLRCAGTLQRSVVAGRGTTFCNFCQR